MNDFLVQLNDLPCELLMYIFKKLCNHEVLYSLMDVNQRINRIAHDRIFTNHLSLLEYCRIDDISVSLSDPILNRFCSKILPEIGHQIETLYLEGTSIERVLHATNYPNLINLGLCDIDGKQAVSLFSDTNPLIHIFNNQISSLFINLLHKENDPFSNSDTYASIFTKILTIFTNLRCLKFNSSSSFRGNLFLCGIPEIVVSSTLLELHINVHSIKDCLCILDGRFDQLRILYIYFNSAIPYAFNVQQNVLPNLRIFSLSCDYGLQINYFNELFVPLLRRMINLEELDLNVTVLCYKNFIDVNTLKKDIMIHMARLYKFTFNVCSIIDHHYQTSFPLNESIEKASEYFSNNQIITCIDHFKTYSLYQIYSYPYKWQIYYDITNHFRGGLFTSVTKVSLRDEHPFEHEFFLRISKSFPFMKQLTIFNEKAQQNNKQLIKSNNDTQILSIIEYPNLIRVDLIYAHDDYVELFLFNMNMLLANNLHLRVDYETLERVTCCFTRYMTENNYAKLAVLYFSLLDKIDEHHLKNYFPYTPYHHTVDFLVSK